MSPAGNGATILTVPDAPLSLAEVLSSKTATTIGLSWIAGTENGGAAVIDYTVSYSTTGTYTVLQSGVTTTSFTAAGLTTGTTYSF